MQHEQEDLEKQILKAYSELTRERKALLRAIAKRLAEETKPTAPITQHA